VKYRVWKEIITESKFGNTRFPVCKESGEKSEIKEVKLKAAGGNEFKKGTR
jgi:hypothetical protein